MRIGHFLAAFAIGTASGCALALAVPAAAGAPPVPRAGVAPGARFAPGHGRARHPADPIYRDDAPGPDIGFRGCLWFEHGDFRGRRGHTPAGANLDWVGRSMDDRISSVACHQDCRLLASEDINNTGARRAFRGNTGDVGPEWNDRISALRVVCEGDR